MKLKRIVTASALGITFMLAFLCSYSGAQNRGRAAAQSGINHKNHFSLRLKTTLAGSKGQISMLALSPDGEMVAADSYREKVTRVWSISTGRLVASMDGTSPSFSPDSRTLLTTGGSNAGLWEAASGQLKFTLSGHQGNITSAVFSPDGSRVATGSEDGTVKLWNVSDGRVGPTLIVWRVKKIPRYRIISRALNIPVSVQVKFSPDGRRVLTNTYWEDSTAKLWDASTGQLEAELGGHTTKVGYETKAAGVIDAQFSPDGKFVLTESIGKVRLWKAANGQLIEEYQGSSQTEFSPDARWLALDAGLLNLETLRLHPTPGLDISFLNQQSFSPDSLTYVAASGHKDYHATLIDVETGQVKAKLPLVARWGFDFVSDYQKDSDILSFHSSSRTLMGANHNSVKFWDVSTGQLIGEITEARDPAAFSRDGTLLVTAGKDKNSLLLWEVKDN